MSYRTEDFIQYNYTDGRPYGIKNIIIHHVAGVATAASIANTLNTRGASAHYCIGCDGVVGTLVEEWTRAWHAGDGVGCGSKGNDMGIGIEVSNDEIGGQWHVSDQSFEILVELCHDIAVRNGFLPLRHGVNLFGHNECSATSCPGPYLGSRLDELCDRVNNFGKAKEEPKVEPKEEPKVEPTPTTEPEDIEKEIEKVIDEPDQPVEVEEKKPSSMLSEEGAGVIYEMYKKAEQIKETKITGVLPHRVYEILRWVLWTVIPAASILLTTLTKAWGWNIPLEQILITASGASLFIGTILGIAKLSNDKK